MALAPRIVETGAQLGKQGLLTQMSVNQTRPAIVVKGKVYVSKTAAAEACGVTIQTYRTWERDTNPPPFNEEVNMVPLGDLGAWMRHFQIFKKGRGGGLPFMPAGMPGRAPTVPGATPPSTPETPDSRHKRLQGDKLELELAERAGMLVPVDEVQGAWETIVTRVRTQMLRIPVSAAPLVLRQKTVHEVQEVLTEHVREALDELANGGGDLNAER